jgi:hypothetical protein
MSDGCLMPNEKCSATSISWREEVIFNDSEFDELLLLSFHSASPGMVKNWNLLLVH